MIASFKRIFRTRVAWGVGWCLPVVGAALFLVWARVETVRLGYRLSEEANRNERLSHENRSLQIELQTLKDPARLRRLAERAEMGPPARVLRLEEPKGNEGTAPMDRGEGRGLR